MKKTTALTIIALALNTLLNINNLQAQNIGINGTGATAHPSALLDVDAAATPSLGILIPRIALQAINVASPVSSPATSLLVYNTASASTGTNAVSPGYYYWDATKWIRLQTSQDWALTGNTGTSPTTNFLGTTDAQDLVVKTNNTERMRVLSTGNVGIGTPAPTASLHIVATATNTGFQLQDGTQGAGKVLTSDATGKGSWSKTSLNIYEHNPWNPLTYAGIPISNNNTTPTYTGLNITLPQGRYLVTIQVGLVTSRNVGTWRYVGYSTSNVPSTVTNTRFLGGLTSGSAVTVESENFIETMTWAIDLSTNLGNTTIYFFQSDAGSSLSVSGCCTDQYSATAIPINN